MYSETTNISRSRLEVYCPSPLLSLYIEKNVRNEKENSPTNRFMRIYRIVQILLKCLKIALKYLALGLKSKVPLVMVLGVAERPYI